MFHVPARLSAAELPDELRARAAMADVPMAFRGQSLAQQVDAVYRAQHMSRELSSSPQHPSRQLSCERVHTAMPALTRVAAPLRVVASNIPVVLVGPSQLGTARTAAAEHVVVDLDAIEATQSSPRRVSEC